MGISVSGFNQKGFKGVQGNQPSTMAKKYNVSVNTFVRGSALKLPDIANLTNKQVFEYVDYSAQDFVVPDDVEWIHAKVWAAGGGGGSYSVSSSNKAAGGVGGFVSALIPVSSGTTLKVIAGRGGQYGSVANGGWPGGGNGVQGSSVYGVGGGGGYSGIFQDTVTHENSLIIAGAGSGGSGLTSGMPGGGLVATKHWHPQAGDAGSQELNTNFTSVVVQENVERTYRTYPGGPLSGGAGGSRYSAWNTSVAPGGGGGSGYYGGEGGFEQVGGPGSSYVTTTAHEIQHIIGDVFNDYTEAPAPNNTDPDYIAGVATSQKSRGGGNGLVVISY